MSYYVYIHTCPNGKRYIGTTCRVPKRRWQGGYGYKTNKHFYRAIQKYTWDNINHQVFEVESESEMYYLERYLIAYYQTNKKGCGYNKSIGGEKSSFGCTWKCKDTSNYHNPKSETHKSHISNALKGRKNIWMYGNDNPAKREDVRIKISNALKGRKKMWMCGNDNPFCKTFHHYIDKDGNIHYSNSGNATRWHKTDWIKID